jgi:hypothetical protein
VLGPVFAVVSGGIGTLLVVATVALRWPVILKVPPLHTLRPAEMTPTPAPEATREPARAGASGA